MARQVVTEEVVAEVAEQLLQGGEEPSIIRVQALIGGGSFSTVKRYLDAWKTRRQAQETPVEVPDEIVARSAEFARTLWQAATALASQEVAQVRGEAQRQVEQARAAEAEAEQVIARLEAEVEERDQQCATYRQERDEARGLLEQERTAAQVAVARLEEQGQRLADLRGQVEALSRELTGARAALVAQARLEGELEALRRQLAQERARQQPGDVGEG